MSKVIHYPSYDEFKELARQGNVIPVYRQLLADTITPVSAFGSMGESEYAFLLESASGGEEVGRYSFLGCNPFMLFSSRREKVTITKDGEKHETESDDPIANLEAAVKELKAVPIKGVPSFCCMAVGYAAYDAVRYVEYLPDAPPDDLEMPDLFFMFYDLVIAFDHLNKTVKVVAAARLDGKAPREVYDAAVARIDATVKRLSQPVAVISDDIRPAGDPKMQFESNFEKADYRDAVRKCKEYIRAGDIFQVVLSQRLQTHVSAKPFDIYRAARVINPSPYMFYLRMGEARLIGASPEVMVRVENGKVLVRPIAGTRRRGSTPEEDLALEKELKADPKERAEHVMLVDLGRNDVGRVARYKTVKIEEEMIVERFSHVMHLTSQVSGQLQAGKTAFDAFRAAFPAGTLSGAPKIRAMEILDELEPTRRGPYGGAVGCIDYYGNMNTCITIRTMLLKNNTAYVQAGGGIVADSVPEREYEETINKAKAMFKALETAEQGL
ncbi:MAG: anthranilate synthase component I [Planctomycetes bacterium]|nr:anthranilate synthase component I [Planctomycetota bacterium]